MHQIFVFTFSASQFSWDSGGFPSREDNLLLISASGATWPPFNRVFSHQIWDLYHRQAHNDPHHFAFCHLFPRKKHSHGNNIHSTHMWIFVRLMGKNNPCFVLRLSSWLLLKPRIPVALKKYVEYSRREKSRIEKSGYLVSQLWHVWNSVGTTFDCSPYGHVLIKQPGCVLSGFVCASTGCSFQSIHTHLNGMSASLSVPTKHFSEPRMPQTC